MSINGTITILVSHKKNISDEISWSSRNLPPFQKFAARGNTGPCPLLNSALHFGQINPGKYSSYYSKSVVNRIIIFVLKTK